MEEWIQNILEYAFGVWDGKVGEMLELLSTSPQHFRGGNIWRVIEAIFETMQGIGLGLVTLFFVMGLVRTSASFTEIKKPEHVFKHFVRFAISKAVVTEGLIIIGLLLSMGQGIIAEIVTSAGLNQMQSTALPETVIQAIEDSGFWANLGNFVIALIGSLIIIVMSFILVLTVYGRFFKLYMYSALAPIPLATFAGESTSNIGKSFLKTYCGVCLEGAIIVLACIIFQNFAVSVPNVDADTSMAVLKYIVEVVFNMLVLVGMIKMSDQIVRNMMGF